MLSDKYQETYDKINNEYKSVNINNFSYDKEYIKSCDFIMDNSFILPIDFIKYAEQQINSHENIQKID